MTTAGDFTEFALPDPIAFPSSLVEDPRGGIWFTEFGGKRVGLLALPLAIASGILPPATLGAAYPFAFAANGGLPPFAWAVVGGNLPPGLALDPGTGALSGVPTAPGEWTFTLRVTDAGGAQAELTLAILVRLPPTPVPLGGPLSLLLLTLVLAGSVFARLRG